MIPEATQHIAQCLTEDDDPHPKTKKSPSQTPTRHTLGNSINQFNIEKHSEVINEYVPGAKPGKKRKTGGTARARINAGKAIWALVAAGITGTAVSVDLGPSSVFWQNGAAFRGGPAPAAAGGQGDDDGAAAAEDEDWKTAHEARIENHRKRKKVKWKQLTLDGREFDSED